MNKKLQRDILEIIRNANQHEGIKFNQIRPRILEKLANSGRYTHTAVAENIQLLKDQQKIEIIESGLGDVQPEMRITFLGYQEFEFWPIKLWRWFTNDMAKILSLIATALGMVSILVSLFAPKLTEVVCKQ